MSDQKIKICCAIHSLRAGGMERVMSELLGYFSEIPEAEVHLILYGIKRDIFYPVPESVTIYRPPFEFDNSKRGYHSLKTLLYLRKTIRSINPHTILSFGEQWNSFLLLATLGLSYPVYVSDRCQPDKPLGKLQDTLRKWLYPKSAGIIAQTGKAKEIYSAQLNHDNIRVIGNPIRSVTNGDAIDVVKDNIVLTVGRIISTKHHDELLKLFLEIKKPGWKLVIVGGDALKQRGMEKLQEMVKEHGAEESVLLEGYRPDVDQYYNKSKIFAFTSSSEGFPNVIGEAMSAGLPVVAFDCTAGPSDMISDGETGCLIPLFNYKLFGEKLKGLMEDEDLRIRYGQNGKEAIKRFSIDSVGKEYYRFISGTVETGLINNDTLQQK